MARFAFHPDFSAHQFHEVFADGQAQACAAVSSRQTVIDLAKGFEQFRTLFFIHANARVLDTELQLIAVVDTLNLQMDVSFLCELQGIGQQVVQDLRQAQAVPLMLTGQLASFVQ